MKFVEANKEVITFKDGSKSVTRKFTKKYGLPTFRYNKKEYVYFTTFIMSYGRSTRIIEVTKDMKSYKDRIDRWCSWNSLEIMLEELVTDFENLKTQDTWVSSEPNTSTFRALKSGNIETLKRPDRFGESYYSRGTYFQKGIKIGGNTSGTKELRNLAIFICAQFSGRLGYNNSKEKATLSYTCGTAFDVIGIG